MASPEGTIDVTIRHLTRLIQQYAIEPHEWPLMEEESPEVWRVIQQIEWLGPQPLEETQKNCTRLILNYGRLFLRRMNRRAQHAAA
jgi:hypothetical protein